MGLSNIDCVWVVACIDRNFINNTQTDLNRYSSYRDITPYIPVIRMLKKDFKNKKEFVNVPMLFNYGFFNIPCDKLYSEFLDDLKKRIPAIYSWVRSGKKSKDLAFVSESEINRLRKFEITASIYSSSDISSLVEGKVITLRGYPFDGIEAVVEHINLSKQEIEVTLILGLASKRVKVSFENVIYTIYKDGDDGNQNNKIISLDELSEKGKNNLDKIYSRNQGYETEF